MGKEQCNTDGSRTFVLKFDMHCKCNGCIKKINDGVKEISLSEGVEKTDLLIGTGEVKVTGRMDPEKVRSLFHAVTRKCVGIVAQSRSDGHAAPSQENKKAPCGWFAPEAGEPSTGARLTPSAPPLPEEEAWSETAAVPGERCWYRWPAPRRSSSGVWAASDVTGTVAMHEL